MRRTSPPPSGPNVLFRRTLAAGLAIAGLGPSPDLISAQRVNPFERDRAAIQAGSALYTNRCAECHGADAKGFSGPDLTLLWTFGTDDEYVFGTIRAGVPGSIMPSSDARDTEIWAMVSFLKSVSTVEPEAYDAGNPDRGRALFEQECARCHRVDGLGGRLGPELTRATLVRSRQQLVRSIRDPDASIAQGYRAVTLATVEGGQVRAVVKGEDAFSVQVMDTDERLQGYRKADLAALVRDDGSLMPALSRERLSDQALEDIFSYLASVAAEAGR